MYVALEIPWGVSHPDVKYWKERKIHVYNGRLLPPELRPYRVQDFSFHKWQEEELNGATLPPTPSSVQFTPRKHQSEAAKKILQAYKNGWPGFLEADKTGLGKTLSTVLGLTLIAMVAGFGPENKAKTLIVCPKGAIPQWRNTLKSYPRSLNYLRPLIINYEQLNKLLDPPASAKTAAKKRTKDRQTARNGKPAVKWDFIVSDEAHKNKNYPNSLQSQAFVSVAQLSEPYKKGTSPFVVYVTATPGSTPLNFAVMSPWLSRLIDPKIKKPVPPKEWGDFLYTHNFNVKKGKKGYTWATVPWFGKNSSDPKERAKYLKAEKEAKASQRKDARRIGAALKHPRAPFIMRSPADLEGWPEQQYIPLPVEMDSKQRRGYEEAWTAFRRWLRLTPAHSDPKGALVQTLRYRQKTSLLKVPSMVDLVKDFVEAGNQVYISVQFIDTIERYSTLLTKAGIKVGEISGRVLGDNREAARIAFQKGEVDVVLCTVVDNLSLHQGEVLPDGTKATDNPRITIIHDVRQNDLDSVQALGRAHRNGTNSITYFPYFEDTVDEKIVNSFTNKNANQRSMVGEDNAEELENLFREAAANHR